MRLTIAVVGSLLMVATGDLRTLEESAFVAFRYDAERVLIYTKASDRPPPDPRQPRAVPERSKRLPAPIARYPGPHVVELEPAGDVRDAIGDPWVIDAAPGVTVPATVERLVLGGGDCFGSYGIIARIDDPWRDAFKAVAFRYHVARRGPGDARLEASRLGEVPGPIAPALRARIEAVIRPELGRAVREVTTAAAPNYTRPHALESWSAAWKQTDAALLRGEGVLSFDVQRFRLTPDGGDRLFVRSDLRLGGKTAFLMTFWLRDAAGSLAVEDRDAQHARHIRIGEFGGLRVLPLSFQGEILGIVDADRDGTAEFLMVIHGYEGHAITAFRYSGARPESAGATFQWGC